MIITVTGTPGTGKTSVAKRLEGYEKIHLTDFVKNYQLGHSGEVAYEVDLESMKDKLDELLEKDTDYVIEGHMAHYCPSDLCIVLRCKPEELEKRLENRGYSREKIEENVESEAMDLILQEAVQKQSTVIEIDTTENAVEETVRRVKDKIEKGEEDYGNVDWSSSL